MITEKITYTDYDGNTNTEDFYFHLSKAELTGLSVEHPEGFEVYIQKIVDEQNISEMYTLFKRLILMSYGEKVDGKKFVKKKNGVPLSEDFESSPAFDVLFDKLLDDPEEAKKFFTGVLPKVEN